MVIGLKQKLGGSHTDTITPSCCQSKILDLKNKEGAAATTNSINENAQSTVLLRGRDDLIDAVEPIEKGAER